MSRFKLTLEYDGSDFCGWQLQPTGRSVQGVLEASFKEVTQEEIRVYPAGRTDAGVHARGQVVHLDSQTGMSPLELRKALNAVLPHDAAVLEVRRVADHFDARRHATSKTYRYRILNRGVPSPLRRFRVWHLRGALDDSAMLAAAEALVGSHDFAAFRGAPGGPKADEVTRRDLSRLEVRREGDEIQVVAQGRSFMRYMVRNLVGTLVDCAQGRLQATEIEEILASRTRSRAGVTAPAHGLCLEHIEYPSAVSSDTK